MTQLQANKPQRNIVLDILRGHFLLAILVDHLTYYVGDSLFIFYNGGGRLWVSAAEGFVFLSGYFVSLIYFPQIVAGNIRKVFTSLIKRGLILYFWSIFLTLFYSYIGTFMGNAPYLNQGILFTDFWEIIINALKLNYFYGWADLIALYVPLILISPFVLYLFKYKLSLIVFISSLYIWYLNLYDIECVRLCISHFDLSSWQLIFVLGMLVAANKGFFANIIQKLNDNILYKLLLFILFLLMLVISIADVFFGVFTGYLKDIITLLFNKETLGPGRIVLFSIVIIVFYTFIKHFQKPILKYFGWILVPFGQNSLFTYIIQSVVLFAIFYLPIQTGYWISALTTSIVIAVVWLIVKIYIKIKKDYV